MLSKSSPKGEKWPFVTKLGNLREKQVFTQSLCKFIFNDKTSNKNS